jgi:electron transport complex protein RnfA
MRLFPIFFSAIFINNIILVRFLGICSFFGMSHRLRSSMGMGLAVSVVLMFSAALTLLLEHFVLVPLHVEFLRTVSFMIVIIAIVQGSELLLKNKLADMYKTFGVYLPLITTNCAVLGVILLNVSHGYNFAQSMANALGVSAGYVLAIFLFTSIRMKLRYAPIPKFIEGYPLIFFTSALMSMAFMGLGGLFGIH